MGVKRGSGGKERDVENERRKRDGAEMVCWWGLSAGATREQAMSPPFSFSFCEAGYFARDRRKNILLVWRE